MQVASEYVKPLRFQHALASNGQGRSLFVYQTFDVERAGVALRGRLIDNDGQPAPEPGAGGASSAGSPGEMPGRSPEHHTEYRRYLQRG